jgi:hypothetical protein
VNLRDSSGNCAVLHPVTRDSGFDSKHNEMTEVESDTQHRQPSSPLPWVRLALITVVNAFSVKRQAEVETKWKHRRIDRLGVQRKHLI